MKQLVLLLIICLGVISYAQSDIIRDANLRGAIEDALGHNRVTQQTLRRVVHLYANGRNITDLTGLEFALNMKELFIADNEITNLAPLSELTQLETLHIYSNPISDVAPLARLSNLKYLLAAGCEIADISALANLTQLIDVRLSWNRITDITSLAHLSELRRLDISNNPIVHYDVLDGLSLEYIDYDQVCDMPPLPLQPRLNNRGFPSVFSAWGSIFGMPVLNQPHLSGIEQMAQHDLYFSGGIFGDYFLNIDNRWALQIPTNYSIQHRNDYIELNPDIVFIMPIDMRDAPKTLFPENSPFWVKSGGLPVEGWPGRYLLDFTNSDVQDMIVGQALAVERCGLYDGVFFDWWSDTGPALTDGHADWSEGYVGLAAEQHARDIILERIRAAARPNFLILANTNRRIIPRTGKHINGSFMETLTPAGILTYWDGDDDEDIEHALIETETALAWLETNLRQPRINGLEGWGFPDESPDSPTNLRWMRAMTTLSLTFSDGYILYNSGSDHAHYWYDFWDADLGRPVGEKGEVYEGTEGLYIREFTNGWAVYNHSGAPRAIHSRKKRRAWRAS